MIRVEGLSKRYGRHRALDSVSFTVEAGEVVGFLGPNGAGKSTTMRILCCVLRADAGRAEVAGHDVAAASRAARAAIGYLPEQTPLYRRMRVVDYLDFVGRVRGLGASERRAALARVRDDCGLEGYERRRIDELSKGYRQRVGLAQALIADPPVLILDEPTSGLDPNEVGRLRELVARLGERKTVLLSTHVLSEVEEVCGRVLILSAGRLVADGPLDRVGRGEQEVLRVVVGAAPDEARAALDGSGGSIRVARALDGGRARLELVGADPAEVARRVAGRGWALHELSTDRPSLEQVFRRATAASSDDDARRPAATAAEAVR
jgi:ABC-2 type transport system ATP-binding protein